MRVLVFAMGLMLAAGGAAWAADTAPQDETAQTVSDKEKVVCKKKQKPNSRFTTRECLTVAQWEERREEARKAFAETQDRVMINTSKGN